MAPSIMNCMRDQPHEADGSAPVDQVYAPLHLHKEKSIHSSSTITSTNAEKQTAMFTADKIVISMRQGKRQRLFIWGGK
jgi:hypothetical protein